MKNKITNVFFGLVITLVFLFLAIAPASAAINPQINFQGKITNPDGTNIANGSYSIVFSLYNVATAGTAIWAETDTVTVTDGVFQVNLGTSCPFLTASACNSSTPIDFNNSAIFLGIKVAADPEMTPRVSFTASPYAFNSDKLGGLDKTGFIQNSITQQATSNFNISGTGIAAVLQAGTFDTTAAGALNIGTTNATSLIIAKAAIPTTVAGSLTVTQATTLNALLSVNNDLQFGQGANRNVSVNANTTANAAGYNLTLAAGAANGSTTGAAGGILALQGGAAAGTGNNNGGTISLDGGAPTAAGTRGTVAIQGTGGATSVGGTLGVSGLITASGGETTTGAVSINATGTANTAIGNATGSFSLTSSALNVTTTGALSGITTLAASSTITGTTLNGTTGLNTGATGGTQRLDATGNLVNVGNITTTGASTLTTGGANGLTIKPTTDNAAAFQLQTAGGVSFLAFSSSTATLNVGPTTANAGTLNVATGAAVQAVTIGSTNTSSSTAIQGGTTG